MSRKPLTPREMTSFRSTVHAYYRAHRRSFPWRIAITPYRVFVSEVMLQQTQADRVAVKFPLFVKRFRGFGPLARAPLASVLSEWQGLGYNRRARTLWEAARIVMQEHGGRLPGSIDKLERLPGIGHHTASSIHAFAFNKPAVFIETNIRSVFIHHFFPRAKSVHDRELYPLIEQTLDRRNPRRWYSALMDYGSMLKKMNPNPSRRSAHYVRQSRFEGSNRQLRGRALKLLLIGPPKTAAQLATLLDTGSVRVRAVLRELCHERLIQKQGEKYSAR